MVSLTICWLWDETTWRILWCVTHILFISGGSGCFKIENITIYSLPGSSRHRLLCWTISLGMSNDSLPFECGWGIGKTFIKVTHSLLVQVKTLFLIKMGSLTHFLMLNKWTLSDFCWKCHSLSINQALMNEIFPGKENVTNHLSTMIWVDVTHFKDYVQFSSTHFLLNIKLGSLPEKSIVAYIQTGTIG